MATYVITKRPGAPAGPIHLTVASGDYVVDDGSNSSITVTDASTAYELASNPFLTLGSVDDTVVTALPPTQIARTSGGQLSKVTEPGVVTDNFKYNANGDLLSYSENGTTHLLQRDSTGQVVGVF